MTGSLFIVAAPSGGGKTTLVRALLKEDSGIQLSISYTTRPPRSGEQDGREYHFVDIATFQAMQTRGDFLESAQVHGNFYGTSQHQLNERLASGLDVLLEIDWQGAQQVRKLFPDSIGIFILPPSMQALDQRLRGRAQDSEAAIEQRLANAKEEVKHVHEFDYVIINNSLQEALRDLLAVVHAARLRVNMQQARFAAMFSQ